MLPTPSPFPGWKVLQLFCRGMPEWLPLPVASNRFFSFRGRSFVVGRLSLAPLGQNPYCKRQRVATFLTVGEYGMRWKSWRTTNDRRLTAFVQSHFLNVVRHGRFHESAERLAPSSGLANRRGRNRLGNLAHQMNG